MLEPAATRPDRTVVASLAHRTQATGWVQSRRNSASPCAPFQTIDSGFTDVLADLRTVRVRRIIVILFECRGTDTKRRNTA